MGGGAELDPFRRTEISPASVEVRDPAVWWHVIPRMGPQSDEPRVRQPATSCTVRPAARRASGRFVSLTRLPLLAGGQRGHLSLQRLDFATDHRTAWARDPRDTLDPRV
jgi:hypothetical protein